MNISYIDLENIGIDYEEDKNIMLEELKEKYKDINVKMIIKIDNNSYLDIYNNHIYKYDNKSEEKWIRII